MVDPEVGAAHLPVDLLQPQALDRHRSGAHPARTPDAGPGDADATRGILAKINSVMIPGINDEHLVDVNREVKARGAFLHNIMPLISDAGARHPFRPDRPARPDARRS